MQGDKHPLLAPCEEKRERDHRPETNHLHVNEKVYSIMRVHRIQLDDGKRSVTYSNNGRFDQNDTPIETENTFSFGPRSIPA